MPCSSPSTVAHKTKLFINGRQLTDLLSRMKCSNNPGLVGQMRDSFKHTFEHTDCRTGAELFCFLYRELTKACVLKVQNPMEEGHPYQIFAFVLCGLLICSGKLLWPRRQLVSFNEGSLAAAYPNSFYFLVTLVAISGIATLSALLTIPLINVSKRCRISREASLIGDRLFNEKETVDKLLGAPSWQEKHSFLLMLSKSNTLRISTYNQLSCLIIPS